MANLEACMARVANMATTTATAARRTAVRATATATATAAIRSEATVHPCVERRVTAASETPTRPKCDRRASRNLLESAPCWTPPDCRMR
jgi:hypothetical protein